MALNPVSLARAFSMNVSGTSFLSWLKDVVSLTKPGIVFSSVLTAVVGMWLAPAPILFWKMLAMIAGTGLSVAGACALNMYLERETDALMPRTQRRPLPAGRLPSAVGLGVGLVFGAVGIGLLALAVNVPTAGLCTIAYLSYTLVYTPLKKYTPLAFVVGTLPGAIPALMGWTAVIPSLSLPAFSLFWIMIWWQLVHSLALAMGLEKQYAQAGIPTFTGHFGIKATRFAVFFTTLGLLGASSLPMVWNHTSWWYGVPVFLLNAWLLTSCVSWMQSQQPVPHAKRFFFHTLVYLILFLVALIVGTMW